MSNKYYYHRAYTDWKYYTGDFAKDENKSAYYRPDRTGRACRKILHLRKTSLSLI